MSGWVGGGRLKGGGGDELLGVVLPVRQETFIVAMERRQESVLRIILAQILRAMMKAISLATARRQQ